MHKEIVFRVATYISTALLIGYKDRISLLIGSARGHMTNRWLSVDYLLYVCLTRNNIIVLHYYRYFSQAQHCNCTIYPLLLRNEKPVLFVLSDFLMHNKVGCSVIALTSYFFKVMSEICIFIARNAVFPILQVVVYPF